MELRRYRIQIIMVAASLLAGIILAFYLNYKHSFNQVTVSGPVNGKVLVYKDLGGDGAFNYDASKPPLYTVSIGDTLTIKQGLYDFVLDNSEGKYTDNVTRSNITTNTKKVALTPTYTEKELRRLLSSEKSAIQAALTRKYPGITENYTITSEHLYMTGVWYGSVLKPATPNFDTLKVILHKTGGSWKLAIDQPMVSIGQPSNTSIPFAVIDAVDRL